MGGNQYDCCLAHPARLAGATGGLGVDSAAPASAFGQGAHRAFAGGVVGAVYALVVAHAAANTGAGTRRPAAGGAGAGHRGAGRRQVLQRARIHVGRYGERADAGTLALRGVAAPANRQADFGEWRVTGRQFSVRGPSNEGRAGNEFKVPVAWTEDKSFDTFENAHASRATLKPLGIDRVYVVTHAWHMPRSQAIFSKAGFDVVPAPTQYATNFRLTLLDFRPYAPALDDGSHFFHEIIGLAWYRLKSALH